MNLNFKTNQTAEIPRTGKPKLMRGKKPLLGVKSDFQKSNEAILETSSVLWQELFTEFETLQKYYVLAQSSSWEDAKASDLHAELLTSLSHIAVHSQTLFDSEMDALE